ncbi:HTH domain-containing protein [Pedobacter nyackensis]|uniref:HTH domain-containing protein n=1 Tax=Pedobacter nyackensis TaxID=475255 RepID=A0A1W2DTI3_9SPHI|nr:HTH domain-containing protein [Pedobacter nyackensis]SMD00358.1 HTH domain-containing protein [Pedobacter nyackensis]
MDTYTSKLRNKLIAEAFYLTKDIEKYGTGFFRIRKEIKDYPTMKFQYKEQVGGFLTELSYITQKITTVSANDTLNDTLNKERFGDILELIKLNKEISMLELSKQLHVSRITISRDLEKLREKGIIKRIGSKKVGFWEIV